MKKRLVFAFVFLVLARLGFAAPGNSGAFAPCPTRQIASGPSNYYTYLETYDPKTGLYDVTLSYRYPGTGFFCLAPNEMKVQVLNLPQAILYGVDVKANLATTLDKVPPKTEILIPYAPPIRVGVQSRASGAVLQSNSDKGVNHGSN